MTREKRLRKTRRTIEKGLHNGLHGLSILHIIFLFNLWEYSPPSYDEYTTGITHTNQMLLSQTIPQHTVLSQNQI